MRRLTSEIRLVDSRRGNPRPSGEVAAAAVFAACALLLLLSVVVLLLRRIPTDKCILGSSLTPDFTLSSRLSSVL
jgi:4-hydroxybenzoate polyprenyltransferase